MKKHEILSLISLLFHTGNMTKAKDRARDLGITLVGTVAHNGSGDIFIAFSTANSGAGVKQNIAQIEMLPNEFLNPVFTATVQATEEAIINALMAAENMEGINNNKVYALPHDRLKKICGNTTVKTHLKQCL